MFQAQDSVFTHRSPHKDESDTSSFGLMRVRDVFISICEEWFRTFSGAMGHSMQVYYYMLRDVQVNVMEGGIKETDSRVEQGRGQQ